MENQSDADKELKLITDGLLFLIKELTDFVDLGTAQELEVVSYIIHEYLTSLLERGEIRRYKLKSDRPKRLFTLAFNHRKSDSNVSIVFEVE